MPLARRVTVLAAVLLLPAFGPAGCGDDGVAAEQWASTVCRALTPWRTSIADLTTQAQRQMSTAKTPVDTRSNLVALLGGAEQASETARRGVADAGVPDVDGGAEVAERFTTSLAKARDAYAAAKSTVQGLPTKDDKAFYAGVTSAFDKLGADYAASALDTDHVGSGDLQRAFDEVPECQ